jgi:hypothetical protein
MNDGGAHIVVAVMRAMRGIVIVFFRFDIERAGAQLGTSGFLAMIMVMTMAVTMPAGQ